MKRVELSPGGCYELECLMKDPASIVRKMQRLGCSKMLYKLGVLEFAEFSIDQEGLHVSVHRRVTEERIGVFDGVRDASDRRVSTVKADIANPPGQWLLNAASTFFRRNTESIVVQAVGDLRQEYFDLLAAQRPRKARWIAFLHYVGIARALSVDRLISWALKQYFGAPTRK